MYQSESYAMKEEDITEPISALPMQQVKIELSYYNDED